MLNAHHNKGLQYQHEILRARLAIREFFLKTIVKEIYENIGQVLSHVRMQLFSLTPERNEITIEKLSSLGSLVEQSVKDLRHICRTFYPDLDIIKDRGWIDMVEYTTRTIDPNAGILIKAGGEPGSMAPGLKLICFGMFQDILLCIKTGGYEFVDVTIECLPGVISSVINYKGDPINWEEANMNAQTDIHSSALTMYERARLIKGKFTVKESKPGVICITLTVPLNSSLYESTY